MKPNILFAFADDWGRYANIYSKYEGNRNICEVLKTPNFDKIANDGVLFYLIIGGSYIGVTIERGDICII